MKDVERLLNELEPERVIVVAIRRDFTNPNAEPGWLAIGGSEAAKAQAIEDARREWQEQREAREARDR